MNANIKIKLEVGARVPRRGSSCAAGYDLTAYTPSGVITIEPKQRLIVRTGVSLVIPDGFYGKIESRSGLAFRNGISVPTGVIDSDYRGEIKVLLYNSDETNPLVIDHGDRIAQIIIQKYEAIEFEVVKEVTTTARGISGFGSTGITS